MDDENNKPMRYDAEKAREALQATAEQVAYRKAMDQMAKAPGAVEEALEAKPQEEARKDG